MPGKLPTRLPTNINAPCTAPRPSADMKEHFRDDERGKRAAFYFLPWHFNFFCRYR